MQPRSFRGIIHQPIKQYQLQFETLVCSFLLYHKNVDAKMAVIVIAA